MIRSGVDLVSDGQLPAGVLTAGDSFLEHTFTLREQDLAQTSEDPLTFLRGRFAAKEAVFKALAMNPDELKRWRDIEVTATRWGAPHVTLHGAALAHAQSLPVIGLSVSITHDQDRHLAFCVAELGEEKELL